ncbi:hypothetical protein DERP_002036 [Dermatophagoides pteronyssinus]|uniref:Uncharacterized protein n=1 Tax=Dermatophagoides pteronyssinus TaxID=6956 RepID=A0ABQ8JGL7_DERPT|nr:hypothetical protein DERP_002036 [Dermatophagoides pteronyssinus]
MACDRKCQWLSNICARLSHFNGENENIEILSVSLFLVPPNHVHLCITTITETVINLLNLIE